MAASRSHLPVIALPLNSSTVGTTAGEVKMDDTVNPSMKVKAKQTQGRRKIPIKKIENKNKKHVTFSKRRKGLFTKASELCVLCGASVAVITFSEAGKVFSFGHPSLDAVVQRYLNNGAPTGGGEADLPAAEVEVLWWERPVEEIGVGELEAFAASLERLRSNVGRRVVALDDFDRAMAVEQVKAEETDDRFLYDPALGWDGSVQYDMIKRDDEQYYQQHQQQCGCGCMEVAHQGVDGGTSAVFMDRFGGFY